MSVTDAPPAGVETGPSPPEHSSARRRDWHRPVRWFGLACLMGAAFLTGYVSWLLWGTGLETTRAQDRLREQVGGFSQPRPVSEAPDPHVKVPLGTAYAVLRVPSIDLDFVVVQGTDHDSLKMGAGHYPDTANPWDGTGRVGIAGHRTTYLAPFFNLDDVAVGDTIDLLTEFGTYTYEVTDNFVVPEEGSGVVLEQTVRPTLVLTTCNPKYGSSQRLIVEARLVSAPSA